MSLPILSAILHNTPTWVFGLFFLLLWMGLRQWRAASLPWARATLVPAGMTCLSLYGALTTLASAPAALLAWAVAAALAFFLLIRRPLPATVRYEPGQGRFFMPGSPLPLILMMGVFFTKYAAGVTFGMHPELARDPAILLAVGLVYGAFSGIFAGRGARLVALSQRSRAALAA